MQKIFYSIIHISGVIVAIIALLNLPAFANATRGSGSVVSYIMLGLSLFLSIYISLKKQFDINNILSLLIITVLSYLSISLITKFVWEESQLTSGGYRGVEDWTYTVRLMLQTLLVTLASYKYAVFVQHTGQSRFYMNGIIGIVFFGTLITILSPFLGFYKAGFFVDNTATTGSILRPAGFYLNPNAAGVQASAALVLVMSLLLRKKISRILIFVMILLCLLSALITLSKGAVMMSLIAIISYFVLGSVSFPKMSSHTKNTYIIVVVLLLIVIAQFIKTVIAEYDDLSEFEKSRINEVIGLLNGKIDRETTTTRSEIATVALQWVAESPIVGWGFGAFHYFKEGDAGAHNMFLMLIGEAGFLPMLFYIVFYIFGIYRSIRIKNVEYRFLSLTFFLVALFFANVNHNLFDNYQIGFLFGFICALSKIDNIEQVEQSIDEDENTPSVFS